VRGEAAAPDAASGQRCHRPDGARRRHRRRRAESARCAWRPSKARRAGPMYQAGTLSGNPLAMVAGIKTLEILGRPGAYEHLDAVTGRLINGLLDAGRAAGHALCGGHISGAPQRLPPCPNTLGVRGRAALLVALPRRHLRRAAPRVCLLVPRCEVAAWLLVSSAPRACAVAAMCRSRCCTVPACLRAARPRSRDRRPAFTSHCRVSLI